MDKKIQYGVISFCPDLTDPHAKSVDVAAVGTVRDHEAAQRGDSQKTFIVSISDIDEIPVIAKDPIALGFIRDLPNFLTKQVKRGVETVGPDELLGWVHHSLRNSLYLSEVHSLDHLEKEKLSYIVEAVAKSVFGDDISLPLTPPAKRESPQSSLMPTSVSSTQPYNSSFIT